jgi:tetratricopeptide (TPR) repeat protein
MLYKHIILLKKWKTFHQDNKLKGLLLISLLLLMGAAIQSVVPKWAQPHDYYNPENRLLLSHINGHHLNQGIEKMNAGKFFAAEHDFKFMLRSFPNHPQALLEIGTLALKQNKPEIASPFYKKAIELYPLTASNYIVYGIFLHQQNEYDKAVDMYKNALKLDPNLSEAHYNLGLSLVKLKKYDDALFHAKKAYELDYPLPGLRNMLKKANAWSNEPLENEN